MILWRLLCILAVRVDSILRSIKDLWQRQPMGLALFIDFSDESSPIDLSDSIQGVSKARCVGQGGMLDIDRVQFTLRSGREESSRQSSFHP